MNKSACAAFFSALIILFPSVLSAQDKALAAANRKTSVRFLKLAEDSLMEKDWDGAYSQAQMGIAYDSSVADLWYICAAAMSGKGNARADIIPFVRKALTDGQWVDYNRDGARILYADLLCDTGLYEQAVDVLDAAPFIYSADSEYIRIKAYYRMNTPESVAKARTRINGARKIYASDMRFPRLFFRYEYAMKKDSVSSEVQAIADSFIARMPEYDNPDAELEIYAALFASGSRKVRMLQAFAAHNMEHPLYARAALEAGLLTQAQALDYFFSFADKTISLSMLESFVPLITDEKVKAVLAEHLNAYNGILTVGRDGEAEPNLTVQYQRGRPQSLSWDRNTDGIQEWTALCDFGVPVSVVLPAEGVSLYYGTYPAVVKAVFSAAKPETVPETVTLADETFNWAPFSMEVPDILRIAPGCVFYVPVVKAEPAVSKTALLKAASGWEKPSSERENGTIVYSMQDGIPETADSYAGGKLYAHTVFSKGIPATRSIDNDGDGIFETTETFGYDSPSVVHSSARENGDTAPELKELSAVPGVYVKMIQIDVDGDTVPDFTEEYLADGGKITSWDNDGDGSWDVRYERFPQKTGENLVETASFYVPPEKKPVTVTSYNGIPVKVVSGNFSYTVTEGSADGLYWIGTEGDPEDEKKAVGMLNQAAAQGVSLIVDTGTKRLLAVRVGDRSYVEILPDSTVSPAGTAETNNGSAD